MFEHQIAFVNRSNFPVNIAITNGNFIYASRNGLGSGQTWEWTGGWPVGYDVFVYHDTEATRIDVAQNNSITGTGYVMIGGSIVLAALALLIEVGTDGAGTPAAMAVSDAAWSSFTGGVTIVSGVVALGGAGIEIVKTTLNPGKLTNIFGTDNYTIEITGNAKPVDGTFSGNQLTDIKLDFDPISLRWINQTGDTRGQVGKYLWIWSKNVQTGAVKDIEIMPDGSIIGVGLDSALYRRSDLADGWTLLDDSQIHVADTSKADRKLVASIKSIAADPAGGVYGLVVNARDSGSRDIYYTPAPGAAAWTRVTPFLSRFDLTAAQSLFTESDKLHVVTDRKIQYFKVENGQSKGSFSSSGKNNSVSTMSIGPSGRALGVNAGKKLCHGSSKGYDPFIQFGDDRSLIAVGQLPNGRPIGIDEQHHLLVAEIFDRSLLPSP